MPAYLIAVHDIEDQASYDEYRTKVVPTLEKFGGRFVTRAGSHTFPEGGSWAPERVVIVEFPHRDALDRWYASPEYQPLIALRKAFTGPNAMLIAIDGA